MNERADLSPGVLRKSAPSFNRQAPLRRDYPCNTSPGIAMPQDVSYMRTERYETIIIGGGQTGLAAAYELQRRDLDYVVLDPGVVLLPEPRQLANMGEFAASLAAYVAHFDLALRLGVSVRSLRRTGGRFEILAGELRYEATSVIVATGNSQSPPDLRLVEGEQGLYLLGGVGRGAALIAERIEAASR